MKKCRCYMDSVFDNNRIYNTNSSRHIPLDGELSQLHPDVIRDKYVHRALTNKTFLSHKPEQYKRIAFIDRRRRIEIMICNIRGTIEDVVFVVEKFRLPTIKANLVEVVSQVEYY